MVFTEVLLHFLMVFLPMLFHILVIIIVISWMMMRAILVFVPRIFHKINRAFAGAITVAIFSPRFSLEVWNTQIYWFSTNDNRPNCNYRLDVPELGNHPCDNG